MTRPLTPAPAPSFARTVLTLATLTFREALGDHYLEICAAVACLMTLLSMTASEVAIFAHNRVMVDFALTAMTLTPLAVSMGASQAIMGQDLGGCAASALLSRPLSRGTWLMGRFVGLWALVLAMVALMAAIFLAVMVALGVPVTPALLWAMALVPVECTIAKAIAMGLRCMSHRTVAAATAVLFAGSGYMTLNLAELNQQKYGPVAATCVRAVQAVVPQMQRINLRALAAQEGEVPEGFVMYAVLYGAGYSAAALMLGAWALRRRKAL